MEIFTKRTEIAAATAQDVSSRATALREHALAADKMTTERGFSVIADEIRRLATQSSEVVIDIQRIIQVTGESVDNLAANSSSVLDFIETRVIPDYDSMMETSEKYNLDAHRFHTLLAEFNASFEELNSTICSVVSVVEQVTNSMEKSAHSVEAITEQSRIIAENNQQVAAILERNVGLTQTIEEIVHRFKI
ncbi:hypothetical protein BP422_21475 [Brevibacillus formosus]|uniref:Methyl-accepting transducer domain-containing protein n=1 Tax=Brevibacillus formosus TaxID=54913 RepID=A0A220ML94_9BACL|nr:methyl-accepting chemotaxis protein [Brevibacillus formosus]ASJ55896.1 hypothetical protein BP422_21475 [Brevibacillus formosus]